MKPPERLRTSGNALCDQPAGGKFTYAEAETVLKSQDHIVVAGHPDDVERFATAG